MSSVVAFITRQDGRSEPLRVTTEAAALVRVHAEMARMALRLGTEGTVEEALIAALGHCNDAVRTAAAQALGEVGSAGAVLPLEEIARSRASVEPVLRRAARQAVVDIQLRLAGAAPGQLSLAADAGGAVSIASKGGEVSLRESPRGRR